MVLAYAAIWTQVGSFDIGRSDFTAFYVGGTLLREGHTGDLYSQAVQQPLHSALIAPDTEANLPFVNTPVAAALVVPVTYLPLDAAYRLWSLLELAVLVLAVVLAIRSVDWPDGTAGVWKLAAGAAALAGVGTLTMFIQAQWTPVLALGLVLAYRWWKTRPSRSRRSSARGVGRDRQTAPGARAPGVSRWLARSPGDHRCARRRRGPCMLPRSRSWDRRA